MRIMMFVSCKYYWKCYCWCVCVLIRAGIVFLLYNSLHVQDGFLQEGTLCISQRVWFMSWLSSDWTVE